MEFADLANHCLDIGEEAAAAAGQGMNVKRYELPVTYDGEDLAVATPPCRCCDGHRQTYRANIYRRRIDFAAFPLLWDLTHS